MEIDGTQRIYCAYSGWYHNDKYTSLYFSKLWKAQAKNESLVEMHHGGGVGGLLPSLTSWGPSPRAHLSTTSPGCIFCSF